MTTVRRYFNALLERQISDDTALRRVVGLFQRELGDIFHNASVRRRKGQYEIDVAVYEQPTPGGRAFRMTNRQISDWVTRAAAKAHPRLYKRLAIKFEPWRIGASSKRLFTAVKIFVDAAQPRTNVDTQG